MAKSDDSPIHTLRLTKKDQDRLMQHLNMPRRSAQREAATSDRRGLRVVYQPPSMVVAITQRNGDVMRYSVLARNLSSGGVAFMHGQFLYPGNLCHVTLIALDGKAHTVAGKIRDCRHVTGLVHEVSVVFDRPLVLPDFVELTADQQARFNAEHPAAAASRARAAAEAQRLTGTAVVTTEFDSDRQMFERWLTRLGLQVTNAGSIRDVIRLAGDKDVVLVVADLQLTALDANELIAELRRGKFDGAVLAMSSDDRDQTHARAIEAGCSAVLTRPCPREAFDDIVRQVMGGSAVDESDQPVRSTLSGDVEMKPVLVQFVDDIQQAVQRLTQAMEAENVEMLDKLCHQLRGAGASYGYAKLATVANAAIQLTRSDTPNVSELTDVVNALIATCNRVSAE